MINFDEEIKKFHPSLEIDDVERVAKTENAASDLTDLMLEVMYGSKKTEAQAPVSSDITE